MGHAIFAPSAAHRWTKCIGSAVHAYMYPPPARSSEAAERGTRLHALAAYYLRHGQFPPGADAEDMDIVRGYAAAIDALMAETGADHCLEERYIPITRECGGTADAVLRTSGLNGTVAIVDLKTGYQRVAVARNPQLMLYAYGATIVSDAATPVTLAIYQPLASPDPLDPVPGLTTWWTTVGDIRAWFRADVVPQLEAFEECRESIDDPRWYVPGEHCKYCDVMASCPSCRDLALAMTTEHRGATAEDGGVVAEDDRVGAPGDALARADAWPESLPACAPPSPTQLLPQQTAWVCDHADVIRAWLAAVESDALGRAMRGETVPGWKVVEAVTRRRVRDEMELIAESAGRYDIFATAKLRPLSELEKILPRDMAARHIEKPKGAPTLARKDDKRPAVTETADLDTLD